MADFNFSEYLSEMGEKLKKIPPAGWAAIAGGGLLAWMLFAPKYDEPGVAKLSGSAGTGVLGEGYSDDSGSYSGGGGGDNAYTNTPTEYDDQGDLYDSVSGKLDAYQSQIDTLSANAEAMQAKLTATASDLEFEKALNDVPSIYFDTKDKSQADGADDILQFTNVVKSVRSNRESGTFSDSQAARAISKIAGTGNNGVGWKEGDNAKISAALSDKSAREAETIRVKEVIKNREAQGLDTKLQREHAARFGLSI